MTPEEEHLQFICSTIATLKPARRDSILQLAGQLHRVLDGRSRSLCIMALCLALAECAATPEEKPPPP